MPIEPMALVLKLHWLQYPGGVKANSHGLQPVVAKKDMIQAPKERRGLTILNAFGL